MLRQGKKKSSAAQTVVGLLLIAVSKLELEM
jgi:hypothetical protein